MLSHQVNAWWRIFPIVTAALLTYPLGLVALCYLIYLLACHELRTHYDGSPLNYWVGATALLVIATFLGWEHPALATILIAVAVVLQALRSWIRPHSRTMV